MKFDIQQLADVLLLQIKGNWIYDPENPSPHDGVKDALSREVPPQTRYVIVDFEHCGFIESGGIGNLVSIKVTVEQRGGRTILCAVPDRVRTSLVVAGVWSLFDSYITRGEALNAIAAVGGRQ